MKYMNYFQALNSQLLLILLTLKLSSMANAQTKSTIRPVEEAKGLPVGSTVTNFEAKDAFGKKYVLYEELKKGPVVIIFIRGNWCPICNRHLKSLQDSLSLIYKKGANVLVVSPEKPEYIKKSIEKTKAEFTILYDEGYKISDLFDVTFLPDTKSRLMYNTVLGAKLKETHSDDTERLPVPATFIIDKNAKIVWRHFNPDYKERATVNQILSNIPIQ